VITGSGLEEGDTSGAAGAAIVAYVDVPIVYFADGLLGGVPNFPGISNQRLEGADASGPAFSGCDRHVTFR